jgi:hypothetical protein
MSMGFTKKKVHGTRLTVHGEAEKSQPKMHGKSWMPAYSGMTEARTVHGKWMAHGARRTVEGKTKSMEVAVHLAPCTLHRQCVTTSAR